MNQQRKGSISSAEDTAAEIRSTLHPPNEPFTAEAVDGLLRKVLNYNAPLPAPTGHVVTHLVSALNILRWKVQGWTGPWPEEQNELRAIQEAIRVLTEILPKRRSEYDADFAMMKSWGTTDAGTRARAHRTAFDSTIKAVRERLAATAPQSELETFDANVRAARSRNAEMEKHADSYVAEARARLEAFDLLVRAANAFRELGMPLTNNMMLVMSPRTELWKDYAEELMASFRSALPRQSKAAAYRFIVEVTPNITGEHPTFFAVESRLKRKPRPPVNRGKRKS